jgi:cleavage and polyadenylation specificity factor subunit 1
MGPKGAPSYFQQQMQRTVFKELLGTVMEIYIDDILTWGSTVTELVENLNKVFARMREYNLTVNPEKCRFGLREIEFVGHVISTMGTPSMSFSIKKLQNVGQFQLPETHKKLKSFLGLTSYFRQHVKDYVTMSHGLNDMIAPYKPRQRLTWTPEQIRQFEELKNSVVNCPKLHFLVPDRPVFVQTDASDYGIGAYLFQRWDDENGTTVEQPIGFISKSLDKVQVRWATVEKEAYAIYFALQRWDHHLRDIHFTLQTDHSNLLFLNEDTKPKVQRWKIQIQEYDFTLEHIAGEDNVVADGLSRHCAVDKDVIPTLSLNSILPLRMDVNTFIDEVYEANGFAADTPRSLIVHEYFEFIELNSKQVLHGNVPRAELPVLPRTIHQLIGRVHRTGTIGDKNAINMNGHGGVEVTIDRLHKLLDAEPALRPEGWTTMRKDVTTFIRKCPCCQKMALLKQQIATRPFTTASYGLHDQVSIDTIGPLPKSADGNKYILTIIDTFSRWVELVPIKDTGSETAAKAILQYIGRYGAPSSFLTDNGSQFVNKTVKDLLALVEIEHCTIHPYSHEENGIVERANKEVMRHLRDIIYDARVESDWSTYVPLVQRIMNSQVHSKTGLAPMELVWGKTLDLNRGILTQRHNSTENLSEWIKKQIHSQTVAIQVASEKQYASDMYQIQKVNRERNFEINEPEFPIGSYVLIGYEEHEPSKLHPRLKGPMRVIAVTKRDNLPSIYTCQDLVSNKPYDFHVKLVRPFHYDAESVNPETVATADDNAFMVEDIRDHRFLNNDRKRSSLQFLVKWIGYEECTWEPYHNTFKLVQAHNYMLMNNLNSYIPKQFK